MSWETSGQGRSSSHADEGGGGDKCVDLTAPSVASFSLFFDSLGLDFEG
jgi:hypothetical protein